MDRETTGSRITVPRGSHSSALYLITAVCGFVDAACFLSMGGVFAEIMTGTALVSDSAVAGGHNKNWRRRSVSIAIFLVSGTAGAALTTWLGPWVPLVVSVALLTVALTGLSVRDGP